MICLTPLDRFGEDVVVEPIIVAELEFRDVQRQVLAADLVIRADHAALNQRPEAFDGVGVNDAVNVFVPCCG